MATKQVSQAEAVRQAIAAGAKSIQEAKDWVAKRFPKVKGTEGSFKTAYYTSGTKPNKKPKGSSPLRQRTALNDGPRHGNGKAVSSSLKEQVGALVELIGHDEAVIVLNRLMAQK